MDTRPFGESVLLEAHRHCTLNQQEIARSAVCGCFYCCSIYPAAAITQWLEDKVDGKAGRTALCPKCGIDSVLASASEAPITAEFLAAMRQRWF